jgi:hypothetical protein
VGKIHGPGGVEGIPSPPSMYRRHHGITAAVMVSPPPSYGITAAVIQSDDGDGTIFDA